LPCGHCWGHGWLEDERANDFDWDVGASRGASKAQGIGWVR